MKKTLFYLIGIIEVFIGLISLVSHFLSQIAVVTLFNPKPLNIYIFVVVTASVSIILGIGMLNLRSWAISLLIFFSGYIVLTKIFIYAGLMIFYPNEMILLPRWVVDLTSVTYHLSILIFLLHLNRNKTV